MNITNFISLEKSQTYDKSKYNKSLYPHANLKYQHNLLKDTISFSAKNKNEGVQEKLSTLDELYTPKFKAKKRINDDGYYITTIIDTQNHEPVDVYIKHDEKCDDFDFFIKENDKYKVIGWRYFDIDDDKRVIKPGHMESIYKNRYAGLGTRGHQLAIERMIQLGLDNVEILSLKEAYPFHYKCGFRPIKDDKPMIYMGTDLDKILEIYSNEWDVPKYILKENLNYIKDNDKILVNEETSKGNLANYYMEKQLPLPDISISMKLDDDALNEWVNRIKSQPILLNLKERQDLKSRT